MKKFQLFSVLMAVALGMTPLLSACNDETPPPHTHGYTTVVNGNTFEDKCTCGEIKEGFRVKLIYEADGSEADAGISIAWRDKTSGTVVAFGETNDYGVVDKPYLTGDEYELVIDEDTLPEITPGAPTSYDKTAFQTQKNGVGLIIPLFSAHKPSNANDPNITGRLNETDDKYYISLNKTYVAKLNSATDKLWYAVQNDGAGNYVVSVNTASDVTATITRYFANSQYVNAPDTSADASVPNELTYRVTYGDGLQDSTFNFQVPDATSYPVYLPFTVSISYQPEIPNVQTEVVIPTHFETQASTYSYTAEGRPGLDGSTPDSTQVNVPCLAPVAGVPKAENGVGEVTTLTSVQAQNMSLEADGYYYTDTGLLVYAKIATPSIFETYTLANHVESLDNMRIYMVREYDLTYEFITKSVNYFGMVTAYAALCNDDGLYPLTEEFCDYLKIVASKEKQGIEGLLATYIAQ